MVSEPASTAVSKCGAKEKTAEQVLTFCPTYCHPNKARVLDVNKNLVTWLIETCPAI